jgi:hypothetical protein
MQRLLLEEQQAAGLQAETLVASPLPVTQQPFTTPPNRYIENQEQVRIDLPCCDRMQQPAKWIKCMDRGWVARYTNGDTPSDLPIITDLYAPADTWGEDKAPQGLPAWFLSALTGTAPTFTTLHRGFEALPQDNWGYVVEVDHYWAINKQRQSTSAQVDQLLIEMGTLCMEQQLCQGRLEMGWATQQIEHLHLGQHGAHQEYKQVHIEATHMNRHGQGRPF